MTEVNEKDLYSVVFYSIAESLNYIDPNAVAITERVMENLKKLELFIHLGEVLEIEEVNYNDSDDGYSTYTIYTIDEEDDDEV